MSFHLHYKFTLLLFLASFRQIWKPLNIILMLTWFDSDCLVIFWRLYFLSALQSDNNNNMFLGVNMFWALILRAHFNSHLAAKMSPSKVPFSCWRFNFLWVQDTDNGAICISSSRFIITMLVIFPVFLSKLF